MLLLNKCLKALANWLIVQVLDLGSNLSDLLVVSELLGDGVVLEVDVGEAVHAAQVAKLVDSADVIALEVEHLQVLCPAHVEHLLDVVVRDV